MKSIKTFSSFVNESASERAYYDMDSKPLKLGDFVEVQDVAGPYGQTKTFQGQITKMPDQYGNLELDGEYSVGSGIWSSVSGKTIGFTEHKDYEHGHKKYFKKINKSEVNPKMQVPKRYRPTYTVRLVDYTNGLNADKRSGSDFPAIATIKGTAEFEKWLADNYPTAVKDTQDIRDILSKKYGSAWYKHYPYLEIHQSSPGSSGYLLKYWIGYKK